MIKKVLNKFKRKEECSVLHTVQLANGDEILIGINKKVKASPFKRNKLKPNIKLKERK